MYIHSTFKFINKNETAQYYRKLLKNITTANLRRSSKFDLLSIYGACNCLKDIKPNHNMNIYIGTQYAVSSNVIKTVKSLSEKNPIIMPFDFLNINGCNGGFNISQILNTSGENVITTSSDFSFEQTLKLAFSKSKQNKEFEALVAGVDESLENIENYSQYLTNKKQQSHDISSWLYCSNNPEHAMVKIEDIKEFENIKELESYLLNNSFDIVKYKNSNLYCGTYSAYDLIEFFETNSETISYKLIYISEDKTGRFITFSCLK